MRHNTKKGRTRFKSTRKTRHGKTRRVQRGGAPVMENGKKVGEYDTTGIGRAVYPEVGEYVGHFNEKGVPHGQGKLTYNNEDVYYGNFSEDKFNGYGVLTHPNGVKYEGDWVDHEMHGHGIYTFAPDPEASALSMYDGDMNNGKFSGQGKRVYYNGDVYVGGWLDDLRKGHGVMKYANGSVYDGNWEEDKINGHGTYTFAPAPTTPGLLNRSVYVGEMKNGDFEGFGTMTYHNGTVYKGMWEADKMNGKGAMKYANGDMYDGNWKDNIKEGHGVLKLANGDEYDGAWSADEMHDGTFTFAPAPPTPGLLNRSVYVGEMKHGKLEGIGKMTYHNGTVYKGMWKADKLNGKGVMKYANGDMYDGNWKDNIKEGHGVLKYANENVYDGNWKEDYMSGEGVMKYANKNVYGGMWNANFMHGQGKMTYPGIGVYEGTWSYDQRQGDGKMTYADGSTYEGEWWKDKMHGDGTMTAANGHVIYEGLWRNDAPIRVFFDPATGILTDNGDYVPPPVSTMRFINSDNMLFTDDKFIRKYQFNDLIYNEEKNVSDELEEDLSTIALLLNRTYYVPSRDRLLRLMNDRRLIRYECTKIDTAHQFSIDTDVNKTVPYFGLNGLVSNQGGVVPLFDLWAAINSGHRAFELIKKGHKLLTVASHHVSYDYGSWVGSAHCQGDKDADIYELRILRLREKPRPRNKTRRNGRSHPYSLHPYNPGR